MINYTLGIRKLYFTNENVNILYKIKINYIENDHLDNRYKYILFYKHYC